MSRGAEKSPASEPAGADRHLYQGPIGDSHHHLWDLSMARHLWLRPEGGAVTLTSRTRGGVVTVAIEDNGIGIAKIALRKLGRPFEQVESQLTKQHRGSGLGLAIAKSLVELHGGAMRIGSTVGKGTLVVVRLPVDVQEAVRAAA